MAKIKFVLKDEKFKDFALNLKLLFCASQDLIHKARNEIKIIPFDENELVIKSFKEPNFINKILYLIGKKSKAQKSYEYALKIANFTPEPIGFINFYESIFLKNSFLITKRFDYDFTIREPLLDKNFSDKERIFKEFADFSSKLHDAGILHLDYSPGNILIKKRSDGYIFKIVDINRMKFKTLELKERLKNFDKLWAKDEDLKIILREYARLQNADEDECVKLGLSYSHALKVRKNFKKRLKGIDVVD